MTTTITMWLLRSRKAEEELHMLTAARKRALDLLQSAPRRPGEPPPDPAALQSMEQNIIRKAEALAAAQAEIVNVMAELDPEPVRRMMTRVYLEGATIEQAAEDLNYCPRHAARLVAKGKQQAEEILRSRGVLFPDTKGKSA